MPIHHGHHGQNNHHREHYTETDDHAHGHPKRVTGDDHRQHAQGGGGRGEEDGPHTAASGFHGGFLGGQTLVDAERLGVFVHDDAVAHHDTDEADDTQQGGHAEVEAKKPLTEEGAKHAQATGTQGEHGQIDFLEIGHKEGQQHQNSGNQALHKLRDDAGVERRQAAVFDTHAFGKVGCDFRVDVLLYLLHAHRLWLPKLHVGGHGDGVFAVATHQLCRMPLGTDVGHLT